MSSIKCYVEAGIGERNEFEYIYCEIYNEKDSSFDKLDFTPVCDMKYPDLIKMGIRECIKFCKSKYHSEQITIITKHESEISIKNLIFTTIDKYSDSIENIDYIRFAKVCKNVENKMKFMESRYTELLTYMYNY